MSTKTIELWTLCFAPSTIEDYDQLMNLNEIRDWWKDNVGDIPSDLSQQIIALGFKPIPVDGVPIWPVKFV